MVNLSPPAEHLAGLLIRMCHERWPTTEEDRKRYFSALQLTDTGVVQSDPDPRKADTHWRDFTTALAGSVEGNCSVFQNQFLGLHLFAYSQLTPNAEPAREGYACLRRLLSQELGDPVEEWGTVIQPACLWRPGALTLVMHCFQERASGIMVGPIHTQRSTAHGAAAMNR